MFGIYTIKKDTLVICYADPDEKRPEAFSKNGNWLLVLRRKR
jgi:hypothetical protein